MDNRELARVAAEHGTPAFVFDEGAFEERLRAVADIFGPQVRLCFAVKANPFLIPAAARFGARLEVCSPGELQICEVLGVDPSLVVFSGVNKTPASVDDALEFGVGVLTAESLKHVRLLQEAAEGRGQVADVLLRLNAGSQFGMSRDDLLQVVRERDSYPNLNFVGIHYFVGTQRLKLKHQRKELAMLRELMAQLRDEFGFTVQRLEYGPGLGVPQFVGDDFSDTLAPARELADDLRETAAQAEITVEMGRFFAAECGTYLTAVNDLKSCEGTNYCIVDGGIHHLTYIGQLMAMKTPIIDVLGAGEASGAAAAPRQPAEDVGQLAGVDQQPSDLRTWCICGSLCTTNDVLAREAQLPALQEGDVLAFRNCGAYAVTEGIHLLLSRPMPAVVMRTPNGTFHLARPMRDTFPLNMPA